ncbi:AAA domain-containing protein [Aquibacillus saliphilus]|uniref:AAA domain-containing protein n=1 Tax=Aquibacillus saliphilus TaxID=1909422 RepID=UPI001CF0BF24|nr:AAA domain-containing protein [Aquibacillus saliphilus]
MDIEQHLILVKNEDKTDQVDFCNYYSGKWQIKYRNNSKVYTYKDTNVVWQSDPNKIDQNTSIVYENNQPISGITNILDFGSHIRLIFKRRYKKTYPCSMLTIEQTSLFNKKATKCFDYLTVLANHVSEKVDGDQTFLSKQYNGLSTISPRSVLSAYLERKPSKSDERLSQVIFPFGFNASQKSAAEKAITEQVSIIEGPPGTGKTQTILNIIANAIINNKTVAVVSNNNSATANVHEKLQKYGLDFITAYLGNKENKETFFNKQNGLYPDMSNWVLEDEDYQSIKTNLKDSQHKLNNMLEWKNKQALLKQEQSEVQTEYAYFADYYTESKLKQLQMNSFFRLSADKVLQILIEYQRLVEKGKVKLSNKLYNLFAYGIYSFKMYEFPPEVVISFLQKTYYKSKIKELTSEIEALGMKLDNYNFDRAMKEYSEDSMKLFKASLAKAYGQDSNRNVFTSDVLWKNFDGFIKEYPVILSTTHSLRNSAAKNYLFDYVLIDESSQVDVVTGALALSCAKNAVIVGDAMQLPNVVPTEVEEKTTRIFESYQLDQAYNYAKHSLLSSVISLYEDIPKTLLKEHYRCHPKIIGFCNQKFYNNELIVLTDDQEIEKPLHLHITTKGNHARGTLNQRQIDVVYNEIIPNQKINTENQSVGVIAPYRMQANELEKTKGSLNIEADTVHKYQGREKDIIILTTVSNEINVNDFADNPNLINVAVSRAVEKLIVVVGEGSEEWHGTNIGDLVRYIKYNSFEITESQIYSVFDLLYSNYSDKLLDVMKNSKQVSEYKSENLMNAVIEKVLSQAEFSSLDFVLHQPLRMLIKDPVKLTDDERKYAMNILTHTDFVIFNKLDKMPVLVIEVDGHAFHADNPTQLRRDEMKDRILQKYNIPIIRMKTTGSDEETVLRKKLVELLRLEVG